VEYDVATAEGPAHVVRLACAVEDPDSGLSEPVGELGTFCSLRLQNSMRRSTGWRRSLVCACAKTTSLAASWPSQESRRSLPMALQAFAPPMETFQRGRDFSAWLGLVPRHHKTGG
jgi:hypothetical protein